MTPPAPTPPRTLRLGLRVPLRDGIELSARLYAPAGHGPWPVIFMLTPYLSSSVYRRSADFNAQGWACVSVDTRGRAESGGKFNVDGPAVGRDGADALAWLRAQPWCDGTVVMRGGSALGNIQWQVLAQAPAGLAAAAPFAAAKPGWDAERNGNIVLLPQVQWLAHVHGRTANLEIYEDTDGFWTDVLRQAYAQRWSLRRLAQVLGPDSGIEEAIEPLLDHPGFDEHWQAQDLRPDDYARIDTPILSMTGYYDGNLAGTLFRHAMHMRHGSATARRKHFLVIGPWDHGGVMVETRSTFGEDFGPASEIPRVPLHLAFYRWALGQGPLPALLQRPVAWFVTGSNRWRWADRLEDVTTATRRLWLDGASPQRGRLVDEPPAAASSAAFAIDPFDQRALGDVVDDDDGLLTSTTYAVPSGDEGVVWLSAPIDAPLELAGVPEVCLQLRADVPDLDLQVTVSEIAADGAVFLLTEALWRARWRDDLAVPKLLPIDATTECRIRRFHFFARRLHAGSRLRLVVKGLDSLEWQRNYHTAEDPARADPARGAVAHVALEQGSHGSWITLPVHVPADDTPPYEGDLTQPLRA
jgi:uncharacterized protein